MTAPDAHATLGWHHVYSGKVRDLYEHPQHPTLMLVVASDRVSAFDHVLEPGIPGKGALLTQLTRWWFERLAVPNHLAVVDPDGPALPEVPAELADRAMLVRRLDMLPIECVVRGYLTGSGWAEYQTSGTVCGIPLPDGLSDGDRLPEPLYTPAFKAPLGEHDENITFERSIELVGEAMATQLRDASLAIFAAASAIAAERVLVVASDRVSAFDHVLEPGIPGKGELLTTLSLWWFDRLSGVPNHLIPEHTLAGSLIPAAVIGSAMLCKTLDMYPVECVVRGYLTGSGWKEYQVSQTVCGIPLPAGLHDGDRLPEPIYTPAWKAPLGQHDENISFERTVELVGADAAAELRALSLEIFRRASDIAEEAGLILADTKFEFGADRETGLIRLADEVLTSDSSRYWDAAAWRSGRTPAERMASFDKQIVRDWLVAHWDQIGEPPVLPAEIVEQTAARYRELLERLTGV